MYYYYYYTNLNTLHEYYQPLKTRSSTYIQDTKSVTKTTTITTKIIKNNNNSDDTLNDNPTTSNLRKNRRDIMEQLLNSNSDEEPSKGDKFNYLKSLQNPKALAKIKDVNSFFKNDEIMKNVEMKMSQVTDDDIKMHINKKWKEKCIEMQLLKQPLPKNT